MRLVHLRIERFRGIHGLDLDLDDTTVLIGENNTGKSSVLDAVAKCLSRTLSRREGAFQEYDYHLQDAESDPTKSEPISITLRFQELAEDEWPDRVVQGLAEAVQVDEHGINSVTLRVKSAYDLAVASFATQWDFLDGAGNPMTKAKNPRLLHTLQQFAPAFHLGAVRDAAQEFRARSQFWGPFVKTQMLDETLQAELQEALEELNQRVLDAHSGFDDVKECLLETSKLVPLGPGDPVHIEALPGRVFDMLSKAQVVLASSSGARLPLTRHGEGTQSLSVMFLFNAFLRARLKEEFDAEAVPLLTLEEPEAHLHPSAIRTLAKFLITLPGQKLIASHSGDVLAGVPLKSIRRLTRRDGSVHAFQLGTGTLTPEEIDKITYHIRSQRGALLFARAWLLVEGESESWLLPELARQLDLDFTLNGVSCVEYRQFDIDPLIKLADDLGIHWHVLPDDDSQGKSDQAKARAKLGARAEIEHMTVSTHSSIERCLWDHGYSAVYEDNVTLARRTAMVTVPNTDPEYANQVIRAAVKSTGKPYLATAVCIAAAEPGSPGVPLILKNAIEAAIALAEKAQ